MGAPLSSYAMLYSRCLHRIRVHNSRGVVIYCESGFQFKCFVRHVDINRSCCYNNNSSHEKQQKNLAWLWRRIRGISGRSQATRDPVTDCFVQVVLANLFHLMRGRVLLNFIPVLGGKPMLFLLGRLSIPYITFYMPSSNFAVTTCTNDDDDQQ